MSGVLSAFVGGSYGFKPINTVAPVVSGTTNVGSTLSTTNGTWTTAPPITSFSYQWFRSPSTAIGGAIASSYTLVVADAGNTIYCRVTANNPIGSVPANSNTTATVRYPVTVTIASATNDYIANTAQVPSYVASFTDVTFIVNGIIGSTSTGSYAFNVNTSWAAGDTVRVINNSYIVGAGGNAGAGGPGALAGGAGNPGGYAMLVSRPITFTNNGLVGSGGGGGGGGGGGNVFLGGTTGGGGGGGGAGVVGGAGGGGGSGTATNGSSGTSGSIGGGGGGGAGGGGSFAAGDGGAGGYFGAAGAAGAASALGNLGGAGGAAGVYALVGLGNVNGGAGLGGTVYGAQG